MITPSCSRPQDDLSAMRAHLGGEVLYFERLGQRLHAITFVSLTGSSFKSNHAPRDLNVQLNDQTFSAGAPSPDFFGGGGRKLLSSGVPPPPWGLSRIDQVS